jgi:hypothetical protein
MKLRVTLLLSAGLLLGAALASAAPAATAAAAAPAPAAPAPLALPATAAPFCAASVSLAAPLLNPRPLPMNAGGCGSCSSSSCIGFPVDTNCFFPVQGGVYQLGKCHLDFTCPADQSDGCTCRTGDDL